MIVYGRNPVREALRGRRRVKQVWAAKNAAREPWLSRRASTRRRGDEIAERCGSDAHQGMCAEVSHYAYADAAALLAATRPVAVALDEVTDPQNLGAVCRTAEVVGATGVVMPERRSAEVTPAVCKASGGRGRASGDRPGAQPRRLPRRRQAGRGLELRRRGRGADRPTAAPDYRGGVVLVLGAEGQGLRPRVASACDDLIALPVRGGSTRST